MVKSHSCRSLKQKLSINIQNENESKHSIKTKNLNLCTVQTCYNKTFLFKRRNKIVRVEQMNCRN